MFNITKRITNHREHMNWGGGGGPETVETLPDWMRPYIEGAMKDIDTSYDKGVMDPYTGQSKTTTGAIKGMKDSLTGDLKDVADSGKGSLDYFKKVVSGEMDIDSAALQDAAAMRQNQEAAKRGAITGTEASQVGSGRTAITDAQRAAINSAEFAQIDADVAEANRLARSQAAGDLITGAGSVYDQGKGVFTDLLDLGATEEGYSKEKAEADYNALLRRFDLYNVGSGATQQATGGK